MTVGELIELLSAYDKGQRIVLWDEWNVDYRSSLKLTELHTGEVEIELT